MLERFRLRFGERPYLPVGVFTGLVGFRFVTVEYLDLLDPLRTVERGRALVRTPAHLRAGDRVSTAPVGFLNDGADAAEAVGLDAVRQLE